MPSASASAASTAAINATGGEINNAPPSNSVAWIVGAIVVIVLAFLFLKGGKR